MAVGLVERNQEKTGIQLEFLNRVDELIMFRPLSQSDVREVIMMRPYQ